MQVVPLTAAHAQPYRDLMLHGYRYASDAFTSTPEERAALPLTWWARRAADPDGMSVAFGIMRGGEMAGTVALEFSSRPKTRHKAHLVGMYVRESWRRRGFGRQLGEAALSEADGRAGIISVTLTVIQGNQQAIALYESLGFSAFGIEPMAICVGDGYKGKVHMWRSNG